MPEGGLDEIMRRGCGTDAPGLLHGPIHSQAADEFPAAWAELRERLDIGADPAIGLLGGSMGAAVAGRGAGAGLERRDDRRAGEPAAAAAFHDRRRLPDFGGLQLDRSRQRRGQATRLRDARERASPDRVHPPASSWVPTTCPPFVATAREVATAIGADLRVLDGMGHALAEEPGIEVSTCRTTSRGGSIRSLRSGSGQHLDVGGGSSPAYSSTTRLVNSSAMRRVCSSVAAIVSGVAAAQSSFT